MRFADEGLDIRGLCRTLGAVFTPRDVVVEEAQACCRSISASLTTRTSVTSMAATRRFWESTTADSRPAAGNGSFPRSIIEIHAVDNRGTAAPVPILTASTPGAGLMIAQARLDRRRLPCGAHPKSCTQ